MTTRTSNEKTINSITKNFEFLLGFFVILAMDEHFTYYLNWWYVEFFKEFPALKSTYASHYNFIGKNLSTDYFNTVIGIFFIPWVSQIYLALSTFKLANKDKENIKSGLVGRIKIFFLIISVFILENFIVAPNFGEAISIYPIVMWMIILTIIMVVYSLFDIAGVLLILLLGGLIPFFIVPDCSNAFQAWMKLNIHPGFEYDARIEYFLGSGALGFLMGHIFYKKNAICKTYFYILMAIGLCFILSYNLSGVSFNGNSSNAFDNEHQLSQNIYGLFYIWGMIMIVISMFTLLSMKNIHINFPVINWVGKHSLTVFGLHRVLFLKVVIPLGMFVFAMLGKGLGASSLEIFTYILLVIGITYFISKMKIYKILFPISFKD